MRSLRKRVQGWSRARRATVDEPLGTSLATILARDQPDLLAMLVDEDLDPTSYHAGSLRYERAWARLDVVEREELEQEAREKERRKRHFSGADYGPPVDLDDPEIELLSEEPLAT